MKTISAAEFDEKFDNGEDISEYLDWENARRGVTFELPLKLLDKLDDQAAKLGLTRQELVQRWLEERLAVPGMADADIKRDVAE